MFIELFDIVYEIHRKRKDVFFDPYDCSFYYDYEYEALPECIKNDLIKLPDSEWRKAANDFIESLLNKKKKNRIKNDICLNHCGFDDFWSEMEKYDVIWEWRNYYSKFLFEKAEKWCIENNIRYTKKINPPGDFFAT